MTMKQIWKLKIDEIDQMIMAVEIGKDGRLMQLYKKKQRLEDAFGRV